MTKDYPVEVYHPGAGKLWWELTKEDGVAGAWGVKPRMASWLRWNVGIGERFTTRQLREALGSDHEHFQRRQRELRDWGWKYLSSNEEPALGEDCILEKYGWWPGESTKAPQTAISGKVRRLVFERDGGRCVLCGRAGGEPYEDGSVAVLTAGHVVPNALGGRSTLDNLRTECGRCNETARADTGSVADPGAVTQSVKALKKSERLELLEWIRRGQRSRTRLDHVYDDYRLGGPIVQDAVREYLESVESREV
ncbi:HNH endonuclease [Corynebacterium doosanense]|uniref:HNH endonuclease n=1 Tax=Corynebacterium doosanense TaxID=1121358 RepID=UPI0009DA20F0|nr:HNH endonuclease [Corynebacterium doosanense]